MDRSRNFSQLHLSGNPVQSIAHRLELGAGAPNPANHQDGMSRVPQSRPDFSDSRQWMQFSSSDGNAVLYFNLVTKQIWGEELGDESNCSMNVDTDGRETFGEQPLAGQDPPMEDFSDDDINAAARIIRTYDRSATQSAPRQSPPLPPSSPNPFSAPGGSVHPNPFDPPDDPVDPSGNPFDPPGNPFGLSGSYQSRNAVESDVESERRFTAEEKGKRAAAGRTSGDEGEGEARGGNATPPPWNTTWDRPATIRDITDLTEAIRMGQREMAHIIIEGLRPQVGPSVGLAGPHDTGNDGDVEGDYPKPGIRRGHAPKRRGHYETVLSAKIRKYMGTLLVPGQNTVTKQEANMFNPNLGPCCGIANFRVHLEGTTCNPWNKSAIEVFINGFLSAHPEYSPSMRDMVKLKSCATLDSMIRKYRESQAARTVQQLEERRLQKNRRERKRKLFNRRFLVATVYPSLKPHIPLLTQLTAAGMSSDEERAGGQYKQYDVIQPAWRSDTVTAWLRIFDALHTQARRRGLFGHQRGAEPRMRIANRRGDPNGRFVPGLPRNAYDDEWFNSQVNSEDTVRPGPRAQYFHNRGTIDLACEPYQGVRS